eukprot:m.487572 g.487572  ORF g.487572 m.487572 type:complete len:1322 (-) comp25148_c0_seq1:70-4035(-)
MAASLFDAEEIASLTLHRKKTISFEHVPFAVLYGLALYQCYITFGLPYQEALAKGEAMVHPNGTSAEEVPLPPCMPLPSPFVPSFLSRLCLGVVIVLHVLMVLLQHWSINFLCFLKYHTATIADATHAKVVPPLHKGKAAVVPISRDMRAPSFEFQKFRYVYETARNGGSKLFRKVFCPDDLPLREYTTTIGLSPRQAERALARHGLNKFEIRMPSFRELYVQGLLSPFSVFQMFCILLWCLDEYWQYSLFTLFMMLVFEGTVVMSRKKNLEALRGMNNKATTLCVRRGGQWRKMSAEKLLPGDVISIITGKSGEDVIPCDCLLLAGSAVVNEATLTGESVPQMKEALAVDDATENQPLDLKLAHKVNVLFGGTRILQHVGVADETQQIVASESSGFNLLEEITDGDDTVPQGTPDGGCLCFVLRTGFESSQGKLVRMIEFSSDNVTGNSREAALLVAFLLIFALAASGYVLNAGLKEGRDQFDLLIHCILIITSVIPPELNMQLALAVNTSIITLIKKHIFCTEPFRIPLAGKVDSCLFDKTGTITTDELVADQVVAPDASGTYETTAPTATPLKASIVIGGCHSLVKIDGKVAGDPLELAAVKAIGWEYEPVSSTAKPNPEKRAAGPTASIIHRHHFTSKLQRMSVIARVQETARSQGELWVLAKGSAEVIGSLLVPSSKPAWYDDVHKELAQKGMRVIALAYKNLAQKGITNIKSLGKLAERRRADDECDLVFAGFIAFRCLVRKDSRKIIMDLQESSHGVAMITGDAILTAAYVAAEVNITSKRTLRLTARRFTDGMDWTALDTGEVIEEFSASSVPDLADNFDLCVTGDALMAATEADASFWDHMRFIKVFARMTPDRKERVITALKDMKHHTLMCGDGANDVGALKQAHVGIALLSGFGSANVDKKSEGNKDESDALALAKAEQEKQLQETKKQTQKPVDPAERMRQNQEELKRMVEERVSRGENQFMAMFRAARELQQREATKQRDLRKKTGGGLAGHAALLASQDMDDGSVPMVKLGDASIASPFTSKLPSIAATIEVIRQGRCTLVTTLQMYQILALNCLIASYSLSVLYLDGVKYGDRQMTAHGMLMTISYLSISRAAPLQKMSSVRPLNSIFHPAMFLSLVGQFAIHLCCMAYVVHMTKPYLPKDFVPNPDGKFEPNLINSVVFLVSSIQQVVVFVVNYKGHPFMNGLTDNRLLMWPLGISGFGAAVAASNIMPGFNKWFQLVEYPSDSYRQMFMGMLIVNVVGTLLWDRLVLGLFAPHILKASLAGTTFKDVRKVLKMVAIMGLVFWLFSGVDFEELERAMEEAERQSA